MALLVVLLLVSVTLALSYAAVRSQFNTLLIHRNAARRVSARAVAVTGLTMAIKKMHTAEWQGVDTTLTGELNAYENFSVTYTAGDPSLAVGDGDYDDLPYRVTLLATGYAADPDNPTGIATHQIRAVVQLIPRALSAEPDDWSEMMNHTVYQWTEGQFKVNVPCRIEGPVRVQAPLELAGPRDLPGGLKWSDEARLRYLTDLNRMRTPSSSANVAVHGEARQSTGSNPGDAIDGSLSTYAATNANGPQWWYVDLYYTYEIDEISIYNRYPDGRRLTDFGGFRLLVYDKSDTVVWARDYWGAEPYPLTVSLAGSGVEGKYVELWKRFPVAGNEGKFNLSEVQVTSKTANVSAQDLRPFDGPLSLPYEAPDENLQEPGLISLLNDDMDVPTTHRATAAADWGYPDDLTTYRVYPGGKVYDVQVIAQVQQNTTLQADPETNPLGIFYRPGKIDLRGEVTVHGTLVTQSGPGGDLHVEGNNIDLKPHDLPPIYGTNVPVRLPAAIIGHNARIHRGAEGTLNGALLVLGAFEIEPGPQDDALMTIHGPIVAKDFKIRRRDEWHGPGLSEDWWEEQYAEFLDQLQGEPNGEGNVNSPGIQYFPLWLQAAAGLEPESPRVIRPGSTLGYHHWKNRYDTHYTLYVPHEADQGGLRWDLIEWTENP